MVSVGFICSYPLCVLSVVGIRGCHPPNGKFGLLCSGWFYHAPPKPEKRDRVVAPPPSQIPGLSNVSQLPPEHQSAHLVIRESDSKYIRLAKQGGRPDLLVMRTPEPPSCEPVGYPRCDWYYDSAPIQSHEKKQS